MINIEQRAQQRDTCAFVTFMTVDVLARKMIGLVGDRRMTMMRRYLGDRAGTPDVRAGLRIDRRGFNPVSHRLGVGVGIHLRPGIHGIGFSVQRMSETEDEARERYRNPDKQWLGRREDLVYVELRGWPGQPSREDSIRIERWNENGVGEEIIVVFDDVDLLEELAWDIKGDQVREVHMWDEFCETHHLHFEHHLHHRSAGCKGRPPTRGETLAALAANALKAEAEQAAKTA
ncbi:hypothetical protein [Actinophytocola sp.]|uniref:hypothetical protein n=1 Tax=Actinophytocola sp. TaxID=1872138 RepID=UPI002D7F0D06|nr:hypothetical protein [Actinophytocola sp.]HET9144052.1 hypothetical protein [Actinophytocola sp.]